METATAIRSQIRKEIAEKKPGTIFFPGDFLHLGSVGGINMALSRLASDGTIERVAHGIYSKPKNDPLFGKSNPSLEEIAEAIAEKEQIRIRPTGTFALNKLGLSTQVPTKVVYLTNGNPRKLKIGKGELTFKKTTHKVMAIKNNTIYLITQALATLGQNSIDSETLQRITNILKNENPGQAREDAKLAPAWIARILYTIINKIVHQ